MNFFECLKSSYFNVFSNKMRTFLTMLGIIIGISSVIMIVAIGNGSQASIEEEFDSFGSGTLSIGLASSVDIETRDLLTMDDYEYLKDMDGIQYISPTYSGSNAVVKLLDPRETNTASVTGVVPDYQYINNETLLYGRYIKQNDVDLKTSVCVIQDTTAMKVFGRCDESVLGEKISLRTWKGTSKLTVIGIVENTSADSSMFTDSMPESITIPISTCMKIFTGDTVSSIVIVPEDPTQNTVLSEQLIAALEEFHGNEGKYSITDTTEILESINSILGYVTLFIGFVAAISLVVGGIGVMNIMMVTVTERTKEIGIRKAIGAKNKDIRTQFLLEAILLTGIGGFIGLVIGYLGAMLIGHFAGVTPVMSVTSIVGAVGISMLIGIVFGVAPANKAAVLDPIEALRFE